MRELLLLAILGLSLSANGRVKGLQNLKGEWGTGGGNALVCFSQKTFSDNSQQENIVEIIKNNNNNVPDKLLSYIESIEIYDLYEAKMERGLARKSAEIVEISKDEEILSYIDRLGERYLTRVEYMHYLIYEGKKILPESNIIITNKPIVEQLNDIANVILPTENCVITTMAAQINTNNYYQLFIDERLYDHPRHSKQSKATLILHEMIYAFLREHKGHTNSSAARAIVRMFISYDKLITESSVAKDLYKLDSVTNSFIPNYFPLQGGPGDDAYEMIPFVDYEESTKQLALSLQFHFYSNKWKKSFQKIEGIVDQFENSNEFEAFHSEVLGMAHVDGINQSVDSFSLLGTTGKIIERGLLINEKKWQNYLSEFIKLTSPIEKELISFLKNLPTENRKSNELLCDRNYSGCFAYLDQYEKADLYLSDTLLVAFEGTPSGVDPSPLYRNVEYLLNPGGQDYIRLSSFFSEGSLDQEYLIFDKPIPAKY